MMQLSASQESSQEKRRGRPRKSQPASQTINPITYPLASQESQTASQTSKPGGGQDSYGTEKKSRTSKSEKDWSNFCSARLGPLVIIILYFCMGDIEKAEFYAPTPGECKELAPHVGRIAPRIEKLLNLPMWAHDLVVTSDDSVALILLVVSYLDRIGAIEKIVPRFVKILHKTGGTKNGRSPEIDSELQARYRQPASQRTAREPGGYQPRDLSELAIAGIGEQYS